MTSQVTTTQDAPLNRAYGKQPLNIVDWQESQQMPLADKRGCQELNIAIFHDQVHSIRKYSMGRDQSDDKISLNHGFVH
jgi:hypothetical protein